MIQLYIEILYNLQLPESALLPMTLLLSLYIKENSLLTERPEQLEYG